MLDVNIMLFAGMNLAKQDKITVASVQRYIKQRPEVGKALDYDEIEHSLDMLVKGNWLEVVEGNEYDGCVYQRYTGKEKGK